MLAASGLVLALNTIVGRRIPATSAAVLSVTQIHGGEGAGLQVQVAYERYYPATINDADSARDALAIAATVGTALEAPDPAFTSEDFAFMLQQRPGAYLWLGQGRGEGSTPLHNPGYDFNDEVMETGIRLHVALAEAHLKA